MTTTLATRGVFGVIIPSTNTVVEAEYNDMRPAGVSFHAGRIFIENESLESDDQFEGFLELLRGETSRAIRDVVTCKPDHLVMGMSAETFWGGAEGNQQLERWVHDECGLAVTTGASACRAALSTLGAKRIGVITPYQPVGDREVARFFSDLGFEVADVAGLRCSTATAIADVTPGEIREAFLSVDGPDVDALVQAGTNLAVVPVAADLERELSKPVVAINAATVWHALRTKGIDDRMFGFGLLLEKH